MQWKYPIVIILLLVAIAITYQHLPDKPCTPSVREIAITIDDLPMLETGSPPPFDKIMQHLIDNQAPAIGFVIANRVDANTAKTLEKFRHAGFPIGSHSYAHLALSRTTADTYIEDLAKADQILAPFMAPGSKYFRYPYLSQSRWRKKQRVKDYLAANHYIIAPITIDSRDFTFNEQLINSPERENPAYLAHMKEVYLDFVWQQTLKMERKQRCVPTKQILLMHANVLNSYFLGDLLQMYRQHGYRFISLQQALAPYS